MTTPDDLVLVRHGESVGNVAAHAERAGDLSKYTKEYSSTPGHRWPITATGIAQVGCTGAWLGTEFVREDGTLFDQHYASPFTRSRQTAGHLGLMHQRVPPVSPQWRVNRALRERDWGDVGSISRTEFRSRPEYALSARHQSSNPLYWTPPGGESIAWVAENRVRNVLDTLHREAAGAQVIAVTHGEMMMAFRLVLERLSDTDFEAMVADRSQRPSNGGVLHYSRTGPTERTGHQHLRWLRQAAPVLVEGGDPTDAAQWTMRVGAWVPIVFATHDNAAMIG